MKTAQWPFVTDETCSDNSKLCKTFDANNATACDTVCSLYALFAGKYRAH